MVSRYPSGWPGDIARQHQDAQPTPPGTKFLPSISSFRQLWRKVPSGKPGVIAAREGVMQREDAMRRVARKKRR